MDRQSLTPCTDAIRAAIASRAQALEPTPAARCWECDAPVGPLQRRHSFNECGAIICTRCEPWVRSVLRSERKGDQS